MTKPITIADIAEQAGVSPSTVSRVLNGSKHVDEEKRTRVLAVVEQHRYRPNALARGLVRGRSMMIGVVVQDITSAFFAQLVQGIEQELDQADYQPILTTTHWRSVRQDNELSSLQLLLDRQVDGVIVLAGRISDKDLQHVAKQTPLAIVARKVAGLESQCITIDNTEAAYRATRYLQGLGHSKIAHIVGPSDHPDAIERLEGYKRALAEAGTPFDPDLIAEGDFLSSSGLIACEQLIARGAGFTALFAGNDDMAYGAMLGLSRHGFRIPDDVSVLGFDDLTYSAYTSPPLSTVRQPALDMGRAAARLVLQQIETQTAEAQVFPSELVLRSSVRRIRLV
jgi:LacI family transcriptional regulator